MKFTESIRITAHHVLPISDFLNRHDLVTSCREEARVLDWLAGEFLPEADVHESYEAWIARQVEQILTSSLLSDTMAGESHIARKVSGIELDAEDKRYLVNALGQHPEARRIWGSLIKLPEAYDIAA